MLGRDNPAYQAIALGNGFHMENPKHALAVDFTSEGIQVRTGAARWGLALSGYGEALGAVTAVAPYATANRVEYRRGALTEWYVNGPLGLEQGFTLEAPPSARNGEALTFALALSGDLQPTMDKGKGGLTLSSASGDAALDYRGLTAFDATGRELPAWLEVDDSRLLVRVDDAGAQYPLVIDPFIEQAKLTASDAAAGDRLGVSVAISGDTVVAGAFGDEVGTNIFQGSSYVFVRPEGSGWVDMTESAKLTASDGAAIDLFGVSVAISGDIVVVGAQSDDIGANGNQGSAYVFVKPVGGWAGNLTESAKLTASDGAAGDEFGRGVAISGDTVVVGARFDDIGANSNQGSAYMFIKPAGGWVGNLTETAKLTASDGEAGDEFGFHSIAVSSDTVAVGAWQDDIGANADQGSAYVFVKPGGGWDGNLTETAKLTASDGAAFDNFGVFVAISGDTVAVGAWLDDIGANFDQGAAYVFVKPAGGWPGNLTESAKLIASDGAAGDQFGLSVVITADMLVAGARGDNSAQGSAYVFDRSADGWAGNLTETDKFTASDGAAGDRFGHYVTISGDSLVVAAFTDDNFQGSVYVFVTDTTPPTWPSGSDLSASDVGLTDLTLFWTEATDNDSVATYLIFQDNALIATVDAAVTTYQVTGLQPDTLYAFKVEACDPTGNCSSDGPSETVKTLSLEEAIGELMTGVGDLVASNVLNQGQGQALVNSLEAALRQLENGNIAAAINGLNAFIRQVEAYVNAGILSPDQGQALLDAVEEIIATIA